VGFVSTIRRLFAVVGVLAGLTAASLVLAATGFEVWERVTGRSILASDQPNPIKAEADIKGIRVAIEMFRRDNGFYPSTQEGLAALVTCPERALHCDPMAYLDRVPIDPWQRDYLYASDGITTFTIRSLGEDGIKSDDDIVGVGAAADRMAEPGK